jgi:hypothetical protein
MTSWVVWAGALVVAALLAFTAYHFSVRTLRAVTAIIVIALIVAITAYGQSPPGGRMPSDLGSAFAFGSDRLSGAFFHAAWELWSGRQAPAPGRLGWTVIGAALLIGYRQCEAWALRRQAPTLDTSKLDEGQPSLGAAITPGGPLTNGQRHDWLAAELKFRLAAVEVHSPPILPGGSRSGGLASIAEASGVTGAGLAGAFIRFFSALWPTPRRYELRVWVEDAVADSTRVTVELDDPRIGGALATKTVVAATVDDAASMAAGYVARQIFSRDPATPPWCYGASDGRDLGALVLARQERVYVESMEDVRQSRREQIAVLWKVTGGDRCAGVVRYELAQLEDLDRNYLTALRLHALNREQYPRFFRGVYRLCMSLEMIADPEFTFFNPAAVRAILDEVLDILCRNGVTATDRCAAGDIHYRTGTHGPSVLSHALRETLLSAARSELALIRRELSLPMVLWNTFARRNERTVWKPQWNPATRQAFRDGVRVAEVLVAVKQRLNEREIAQRRGATGKPGGRDASLRAPVRIAAAIAGDAGPIRTVLYRPFQEWADPGVPLSAAGGPLPIERDRVRWLPWQARTASWQAAYNTACLYAVLVQHGLAGEEKVIASLRRVVGNRDSGLERPYDWISNDPDFAPLLRPHSPHRSIRSFLTTQERRDYPARQTFHSREPTL